MHERGADFVRDVIGDVALCRDQLRKPIAQSVRMARQQAEFIGYFATGNRTIQVALFDRFKGRVDVFDAQSQPSCRNPGSGERCGENEHAGDQKRKA